MPKIVLYLFSHFLLASLISNVQSKFIYKELRVVFYDLIYCPSQSILDLIWGSWTLRSCKSLKQVWLKDLASYEKNNTWSSKLQNGQGDHSGYQIFCLYPWSNMVVLQQKIWLLFWIFICFNQTMYFKENVEKKMKNMWFFPEIIFSDFLSLALDHSWSLQSQWKEQSHLQDKIKSKLHVLVISLVFAGLKCLFNFIFSFPTFKTE